MDIRGLKPLKAALLGLAAAAACVVSTAGTAEAAFSFIPQGNGASPLTGITGFGPAQGNALSAGGVSAVVNFLSGGPAAGNVFTEYYQATLTNLTNQQGSVPVAGLGTSFQITIVAKVNEVVTSASLANGTATFTLAPNQTGSFLQMYENNAVTASNQLGTHFTDGTQILSATPLLDGVASNFTNFGTTSPHLDSNDTSAYPTVSTINGSGNTTIDFTVTPGSQNAAFFPGTPPPNILALSFSSGTILPFSIEPSQTFAFAGVTPNLGGANATNGLTGPDLLLQTTQGSLNAVVPEPSSVVLMGLGLVGVGAFVRRQRLQNV